MLPKRTNLWECKVNEETSLYEHSNEGIEISIYLILIMRWENNLISYDVLILEASFNDMWVEYNGTWYWVPID